MRDKLAGDLLPVAIEVGGGRIEEREASAVGWLLAALEQRRVERAAERVGADVVAARTAHDGRRAQLVEHALHGRSDPFLRGAAPPRRHRTSGPSEVEQ